MIELASSGAARFVPIDTERNLVNKASGNPEPVFLQGMMARAVANAADHHIFLGYVEGTPYFAIDVTGKETPLAEMGEFVDLRQVGVRVSVIAELVPFLDDLADHLRVLLGPSAGEEEGAVETFFAQRGQDSRSGRGAARQASGLSHECSEGHGVECGPHVAQHADSGMGRSL